MGKSIIVYSNIPMYSQYMANHFLFLISNFVLCSTDYWAKFIELSVFIKHQICITVQDQLTPLHIASQNGHSSTVETLIKAGADVKAVDNVSCFVRVCLSPYNIIALCYYLGAMDSITYCFTKWSQFNSGSFDQSWSIC